jgi:hypothetical protein
LVIYYDWNSIKPPVLFGLANPIHILPLYSLLRAIGFQLQSLLDFHLRRELVYSLDIQLRLERENLHLDIQLRLELGYLDFHLRRELGYSKKCDCLDASSLGTL